MQTSMSRMQSERVWRSLIRRRAPVFPSGEGASRRWAALDGGIPVVCFLALVLVVVLSGALMLFDWVTAVPQSVLAACPGFHDCVAPPFDETQASWAEDLRVDGPRMIR
jgi:hypothetical protein